MEIYRISISGLAEVEERIKHKIEQIEEEMDNTHEREILMD
jgi:hypothetical protein